MRTSNYIHYVTLPDRNDYYVVHGYTGAIDRVGPEVVRFLLDHRDSTSGPYASTHTKDEAIALRSLGDKSMSSVRPETIEILASRGYLTDKSVQEEHEYVVRLTHRFHDLAVSRQRPGFLMIPTYECNLRCPYCFETETRIDLNKEGRLKDVMSREIADAAFQTIDILLERKLPDKTLLEQARRGTGITLYGGEPLQHATLPIVEYIVAKGRSLGMIFSAITNGLELRDFGELLGPNGIRWMQVTLDGPEDIHDVNRIGPQYRHTYGTIMDNLEFAVGRGAAVSVRLHTDWKSVDRTPEIMRELEKRGLLANKRFSLYATPRHKWHVGQALPIYPNMAHHELKEKIDKWSSSCSCAGGQMTQASAPGDSVKETNGCSSGCSCASKHMKQVGVTDDRVTEKLRKYLRGGIAELSTVMEFCSANTGGLHILDPFGAMYSCWDTVGVPAEKIGTYSMQGPIYNQRADDWKNRCPGDIPQCSNCKYVMFHFGGCAGLPVEMGYGLLHPACYAFADMFILQARKFFNDEKFRELLSPAPHAPVDTPMDVDLALRRD